MTQIVAIPPNDYTSKQKFIAALEAGIEFQIMDVSSKWNGKPVTLESLRANGDTQVKIRYNQLRRQAIIEVP
jgi:hypothetical protein